MVLPVGALVMLALRRPSRLDAHSTHVDHRFRGEADRAFHAKSITRAVVTGLVFATSTASTCWSNSR
ncbi:MAG: hypothetical protein Q8S33_13515, partial [Myxococcales bacterium]|nr:hypothetical protein [Myxococcales bacterium]